MMKHKAILVLSLILLLSGMRTAFAQGVNFFDTEPEKFLSEFTGLLNKEGPKSRQAAADISTLWNGGTLSEEDKVTFITQVNIMVSKKYKTEGGLTNYAMALLQIMRDDNQIKIPNEEFFEVSMSCIFNLAPDRVNAYLKNLIEYLPEGYVKKNQRFSWRSTQNAARLYYLTLEDDKGSYSAPVVQIKNTDLVFLSARDSTRIIGTSGDYNLIARTFVGRGGTATWAKVGLPTEDVYCEFSDYKLNFNFGAVEADTVNFYYKSILDRPLVGRYVDKNLGFRNVNGASYPSFKSHEGGVVIENLIPNVRYEGGFALQGVKKIGSAYDIWVDYVPPVTTFGDESDDFYSHYSSDEFSSDEKSDDFYEDEFGEYYSDEAAPVDDWATSSSEDDWATGSDEEFVVEEGYAGVEEVDPEVGFFSNKVRQHILAKLEILRESEVVMRLQGEAFVLEPDRLIGNNLSATVYLSDEDTLGHPGLDLLYSVENNTVTLKKPNKGTYANRPFNSSFHEYYLYFESINWDLDTDDMKFTAFIDRENKVAAIESYDYFSKDRFDNFKKVLKIHPIGAIYRYALTHEGQPIFAEAVLEENQIMDQKSGFVQSLPGLEGSGFIKLDKKTGEIIPQPKLYAWMLAVRGKKDYDAVQVISKVDTGAHAIMRLDTKEIEMRGVPFFTLSDSQYVRVVPINNTVFVQKNRNLKFGGAVASGRINFYSSNEENPNFTFDYESFKIHCDSLDSMRFVLVRNPPPGYEYSPLEQALSNTVFEGITGAIHIDAPNNKSGKENNPQFPIFDSYSYSYLYWSKPSIQGGVYAKDKLYFSIDPFVLDSLKTFDESGLNFDGELFSSEIFPKFRQSLAVMPDFTLGFKMESPPEGYYVYDGKGRYYENITLDGSGLHGAGRLEHMGTVAISDSFVFHFDSVMAQIKDFSLRRGFRNGHYVPDVEAETAGYVWYTKEDKMTLSSGEKPIKMFAGEGEFQGVLTMSDQGLVGNGSVTLGQARITGDSIRFKEMDFEASDAIFTIVDEEDKELNHFIASGLEVKYDVWRHRATFETDSVGKALATFPIHQYRTSLTKGEYNRATNDLKLEGASSYIRDNYFLALGSNADSLKFNAKESYYKIDTRSVEVSGVPYIYVADATVTPDRLEVFIEEGGLIKKLSNAVIEADQESRLHRIYEAEVTIYSANEYEGSGKYDYIEVNGRPQYIEFGNIRVNSDTTTVASGIISGSQDFYLTERIFFRGNAELNASRKFLAFEGEVKIESENPVFKGAWFTFDKTIVNPDSVFIPIADKLTNDDGEELTVGLNYVPENRVFYSNFLQAKDDDDDAVVLGASGGLTFDRTKKEFKIGTEEKIKNQTYKGATVSFNDAENTITSQGYLNFPYGFEEKTIEMKMAGSWKDDLRNRQLSTNLVVGVNMSVIPAEQLEKLSESLLFLTASNKDIDFRQQEMLENVSEFLDEGKRDDKETRKFLETVKNAMVYTDIKLSRLLPYTLLLSDVNFNYSRDEKALFCDSEVGLIGLNGVPINKMVNSKIVYKFGSISASGEKMPDRLTLYLEVDEFNWVYFHVEEEVVYTTSSYYDNYNYPLQAIIDKRKGGEGDYRFELANEDEVSKFRQEFVVKFIR